MSLKSYLAASLIFIVGPLASSGQNAPPLIVDAHRPTGKLVRIELIGDSTQTDNAGYGRGFCANLSPLVDCVNLARGGTSTKTYRRDGYWDTAIASRPDYMLIQFGHNDMVSPAHAEREVPLEDYKTNLRNFVLEARANHVKPVLITPLVRRFFGTDGKVHSNLTEYADAMTSVAGALDVPLIELHSESIAYVNNIGEERANKLGITKKDSEGKLAWDETHLNWNGSYVFGRMVAEDLGRAEPELQKYVAAVAASLPPEGALAMKVFHRAPFKIALIGESAATGEHGWSTGFCAALTPNVTCLNEPMNEQSISAYLTSGAWANALKMKAAFYFIEFGNLGSDCSQKNMTAEYEASLSKMAQDVRDSGSIPVLLSPEASTGSIAPDGNKEEGLKSCAAAVRHLAAEKRVTFVDLYRISQRIQDESIGGESERPAPLALPISQANQENADAARKSLPATSMCARVGRAIADDVVRLEVELGPNVIGIPQRVIASTPIQPPRQ